MPRSAHGVRVVGGAVSFGTEVDPAGQVSSEDASTSGVGGPAGPIEPAGPAGARAPAGAAAPCGPAGPTGPCGPAGPRGRAKAGCPARGNCPPESASTIVFIAGYRHEGRRPNGSRALREVDDVVLEPASRGERQEYVLAAVLDLDRVF
jgi:hypothetical protein